jgi:putative FmdB family regulatory protein
MPVYVYTCKAGHTTEVICCIADRDKKVSCATCQKRAKRTTTPVAGIVRNPAVPRSK